MINELKNSTSTNNSFIDTLQVFADGMDILINNIIASNKDFNFNYIPIADSAGPYFGLVNQTIFLNGFNSVSPISNITQYSWDLDMDGQFDDSFEPNPSVTFAYPLKGLIGLKVVNQDNRPDVSYSSIEIQNTNDFPMINNFSPLDQNITIIYNDSIPFSISASDPNNDNLRIEWLVDNQTALLGSNSFLYTSSFNDIGSHIVQAKVSDLHPINGISLKTWLVEVNGLDTDNDGWTSNIDCNDDSSAVNPGVQEIRYNGIDDDCNSQTLDGNSPPLVQTIKIHTAFQNVSALYFTSGF